MKFTVGKKYEAYDLMGNPTGKFVLCTEVKSINARFRHSVYSSFYKADLVFGSLKLWNVLFNIWNVTALHLKGDVDNSDTPPTLTLGYVQKCDCGGYTTFKTYAKECHSHWCEVQKC